MNNENNQINHEKVNFFIDFFSLMGIGYGAILSFFCPIIGIILGFLFLSANNQKIRKIGKVYLILGIIGAIVIIGIIYISIFFTTHFLPFWQRFSY